MNNFQIFNASLNNALTDSQYTNSQDRINGVLGEIAKSTVHNKLFAQTSAGVYALAKFVADHGQNALDRDPDGFAQNIETVILGLINTVVSDRVPNTRASATVYKKGDVVDSPYIPKWGELECITAGTSANTDVINGVTINAIGQQINDGTVVWAIRAKRFHTLLNTPIPFRGSWSTPSLVGEPSYPIHPEINLPMWDYRLCDGTNGTIDMRDRFIMGSDRAKAGIKDGQDQISIKKSNLPTGTFALNITLKKYEHTLKFDPKEFTSGAESQPHQHEVPDLGYYVNVQGGQGYGVKTIVGNPTKTGAEDKTHTHKTKISYPDVKLDHGHDVAGTVALNNTTQEKISNVSQHYKMTYIQRIY